MRVIAYELNEVPWRVVDDHVKTHPDGAIAQLLEGGASFTTQAADEGHLSPWITWPTMHRGVPKTEHGVAFLGQDPKTFRNEPLWQTARRAGKRIGIFGSLQSWPPTDPGERGFYLPDTFAPDASAIPSALGHFQEFNLANARGNGRVVQSGLDLRAALSGAWRLPLVGVRAGTLASAAAQVAAERRDARRKYRRPAFQSVLGFDVFERQYARSRPDYAAFFTNHVAGLMHRFWRARYPSDYPDGLGPDDPYFAEAIPWAMEVADQHIGRLMKRVGRSKDTVLVLASSMGQHAVQPTSSGEELSLADVPKLLGAISYHGAWERKQAMEPQVPIALPDEASARRVMQGVLQITDSDGDSVFEVDKVGLTLSLTALPSHHAIAERQVIVHTPTGKQLVPLEAVGLRALAPDTPGTAYHVPAGTLVFYGNGIRHDESRRDVSALSYAPTILDLLGVAPAPAMKGRSLARDILQDKSSA